MKKRKKTLNIENMFDALYTGQADCHCTKCGTFVTTAEPDASWEGGNGMKECPECGEGTKIESEMVSAGLI